MRFRQKNKIDKTILVLSDLHLGAGIMFDGRRNFLEDFQSDRELVDFFNYFSTDEYSSREVEIVINGDFFDLLAVPYVEFFDDEYWSENAGVEKLKIILNAHPEVMNSINQFLSIKKKRVVYIVGNHDGEVILPNVQKTLMKALDENVRDKFIINIGDVLLNMLNVH